MGSVDWTVFLSFQTRFQYDFSRPLHSSCSCFSSPPLSFTLTSIGTSFSLVFVRTSSSLLSLIVTYLDESNIGSLLPKRLTAHVESVLADHSCVLAFAGDHTVTVTVSIRSNRHA